MSKYQESSYGGNRDVKQFDGNVFDHIYTGILRRIYRPPIPPRWPLLAQDKWCACVLSTRLGSTSELVIDNFNVLVQVVSLGIFWLSAVVPRGL